MNNLRKMQETLSKRNEIIELIRQNIKPLRDSVDHSCWATAFDFLGLFSPSLITELITGGYKKGRLLKNKPKTKRYKECFFDKAGNCLYFESYNEFGCDSTTYFYRTEDCILIAPFIGQTDDEYPSYVFITVYDDSNRIKEYSELTPSSITTESYEYLNEEEALCTRTTYVPKRKDPISEAKCWLRLKNNKVIQLKYYEIDHGEENCTYSYDKDKNR